MTKNNRAGPEFTCNVGDLGSICGLGRSPGEGNGYPLQYSGLENSMDCIVSPWGHKESDMTERLFTHTIIQNDTAVIKTSVLKNDYMDNINSIFLL